MQEKILPPYPEATHEEIADLLKDKTNPVLHGKAEKVILGNFFTEDPIKPAILARLIPQVLDIFLQKIFLLKQ